MGYLFAARYRFQHVLVLWPLVLGACSQGRQPGQTGPAPANQSQTDSNSRTAAEKPLFDGQIEHVSMYPVPNRREDLAVSLIVSVTNSGAPGVAQDWKLEVSSPSRKVPMVVDPVHISGYVELPGTSGPKIDLAKEDLATKTAQVTIAKGSNVKGVLTFVLSKTSEIDVSNNNTNFTVNFKDSQGNSYRTRKYLIGQKVKQASEK